jgi:hypothetical protein
MVASDAAARVVVCDAGPLIHLDELERINLLDDFADVLVPTAVWNEVIRHRPSALTVTGVPLRRVSAGSTLAADLDVLARTFPLHEGERHPISRRSPQTHDGNRTGGSAAILTRFVHAALETGFAP